MDRIKARLKNFLESEIGMLVILGLITLVSFGIFVPFTGFYWDDWIWKFFSSAYSSEYLLWQPVDRPLAGTLHILLNRLFADDPLKWQLGNLFFRWANAAGFYYLMRRVLPARKDIPAILAIIFLVFPVFSEQWISIAFIHHLVPMSVLWISFILMFTAVETKPRGKRLGLFGLSIFLAVLVMLTTEYFYGIEAFRVVLLVYLLRKQSPQKKISGVLWETVKLWWAYAAVIILMVAWRAGLGVAEGASYAVHLNRMFTAGIPAGIWNFISMVASGIYSATVVVFGKLFTIPQSAELGLFKTVFFYVLIVVTLSLFLIYFHGLFSRNTVEKRTAFELIALGLGGLVIGGLPFWVGGLQYQPSFPDDRLGLPLMLGASFLVVGLILLLSRYRRVVSVVLAIVATLSVGTNYLTGAAYAKSWAEQQVFWRQFVTRVPNLEPGTAVITAQLPPDFMNDLSFMMTLNWLYDQNPNEESLQYGLFFSDSRGMLETISAQMPLVYDQRMVKFESEIEKSLVISYNQNSCLHVFAADHGALNPSSRHVDPQILPFSDQDLIKLHPPQFSNWPEFFDPITTDSWCQSYQLAELAVQRGAYAEAAQLGDQAFSDGAVPQKIWELAPFIEGYGFSSRWEDALNLTAEVVATDHRTEELLCVVWDRIESGMPESEKKQTAFTQLEEVLSCKD